MLVIVVEKLPHLNHSELLILKILSKAEVAPRYTLLTLLTLLTQLTLFTLFILLTVTTVTNIAAVAHDGL